METVAAQWVYGDFVPCGFTLFRNGAGGRVLIQALYDTKPNYRDFELFETAAEYFMKATTTKRRT